MGHLFDEEGFFWPSVRAPLQTPNLFLPSYAMFYYISISLLHCFHPETLFTLDL